MIRYSKYSTRQISNTLIKDITDALQNIQYGSVELHVVDNEVTQITKRDIQKTTRTNKQ